MENVSPSQLNLNMLLPYRAQNLDAVGTTHKIKIYIFNCTGVITEYHYRARDMDDFALVVDIARDEALTLINNWEFTFIQNVTSVDLFVTG